MSSGMHPASSTAMTARKTRRRRAQRGAAMTESLVLIPVLILIDVALMYMYSAYDTRLATMRGARDEAWSYAISACEEPGPSSSRDGNDNALGPLGGALGAVRYLAQGSMLRHLDPNLDVGAATSVKASKGSNTVEAFGSRTITTHSRVLCNEKPTSISSWEKHGAVFAAYGALL